MAMVINTNTLSLNAQRNLSTSGSMLSQSLQRLSSGLRINSSKDDAAGMAIAERFTTQIRGLTQAARNANDGISLAQTAEGALAEVTSNLQRIRELAVQSANASNSVSDRAALDREVQQRLSEINRIASQTSFNGQKILDGSFGSAAFQVGANVGETIEIGLSTSMKTSAIGAKASSTGTVDLGTLFTSGATAATAATYKTAGYAGGFDFSTTSATFTVTGLSGTDTVTLTTDTTDLSGLATAINSQLTTSGVTVAANGADLDFTDGTAGAGSIAFGGADATLMTTGGTSTAGADAVAGTAAAYTVGAFTLAVGSGTAVDLSGSYDTADDLVAAINSQVGGVYAEVDSSGFLALSSAEDIVVGAGAGTTALGLTAGTVAASGDLAAANVLTVTGANDIMQRIDSALTSVQTLRSTLGAIQGRFESTITNLQTATENLSASRSRIMDADFAAETANLTKAQILQQAGTAILAQANSVPQNVLSLLK
ncbi:MAG: hypothetical protein RL026_2170 [Pseudomonadota bacterium]|jgi:flagellin